MLLGLFTRTWRCQGWRLLKSTSARGCLRPERQAQVCDAVERVLADLSDHVDVELAKDENPEVAQTPIDASAGRPAGAGWIGIMSGWPHTARSGRLRDFWCSCSNGREFDPRRRS